MKAIEQAPLVVRLWDHNWDLIASFIGDEAPREAMQWFEASEHSRLHATADRGADRWSGTIEGESESEWVDEPDRIDIPSLEASVRALEEGMELMRRAREAGL